MRKLVRVQVPSRLPGVLLDPPFGGFLLRVKGCYNKDMEKRIRAYEKFIKKASGGELGEAERGRLARYHYEMMESFQHERLCHLLVMLFFVLVTVVFLLITAWTIAVSGFVVELLPLYVLVGLLVILTGCYVRHYYFLENHIQKLYDYTAKLSGVKEIN